jgi:hypothetical protein
MIRIFLAAAVLVVVTVPAIAQKHRVDCPTHCLDVCAMQPGMYKDECVQHCSVNCYRTQAEKKAK